MKAHKAVTLPKAQKSPKTDAAYKYTDKSRPDRSAFSFHCVATLPRRQILQIKARIIIENAAIKGIVSPTM